MEYSLSCTDCKKRYGPDYPFQYCSSCGKNLEVVYKSNPKPTNRKRKAFWDYEEVLPSGIYKPYELGGTALIQSYESENLYLKLEIENPTRSFKDRGSVVEVAKAREYGYKEIACASTGNMAYSLSYYAKLEGIRATVFISSDANKDKLRDIMETGDAEIKRVKGDFNKALGLAYRYAKREGAFLTGDYCYRKEGQKTVGYEIMDQLPSATHIIVPVGNATLISGIFRGLEEMRSSRIISRLPKIVAVQSERCSPLVKAFKGKRAIRYERPRTAADAIAVGYPTFGEQALEAIHSTNGTAVTVSEKEMAEEQEGFEKEYGMIVEFAGVASIMAARKIRLGKSDRAVAIISGGNV